MKFLIVTTRIMSVMNNETDIITDILAGDSGAYRKLVERYQTGLIIHCDQLVLDRHAAEDIAQDSFIKAYENLRAYNGSKASFSTWLYRIATNKCIDHLRKNKRFARMPAVEPIAEQALTQAEINHIRKAVDNMQPPEYSRVVKAYFWEGKSYTQIASELHTTTGTVGTWISRAKTQLKKELA